VKTYYDLLRVAPDASAAQIKQAFRQIIARYHPDKVQHLGAEFQEMAQVRSAELTTAYYTLIDAGRRAEYDRSTSSGVAQPPQTVHPAGRPDGADVAAAPAPSMEQSAAEALDMTFQSLRSGRDVLLRRAALARLEHLFDQAFATSERTSVPGFDLSRLSKPRLFDRARGRPWLLGKFVSKLDRQAVQQAWTQAARANAAKKAAVSVFLLSGDVATGGEIAEVIAAHNRRRADSAHSIVIIPVDVRDWKAMIPTDAEPAVRSLADRLRTT